jgi:hypothetical protein
MTNELLQALAEVPPLDTAVRWPDEPDLQAEAVTNGVMASPTAGLQYLEALRLCLDRSESLDQLAGELYRCGTYFGAHNGSEAAGFLWSLADVITASINQEGADR